MPENNLEYTVLKELVNELKEDKVLEKISYFSIKDVTTENKDRLYAVGIAYKNMLNYSKSISWFKISAERNNRGAQYEMGEFYRHGRGVPSDYLLSMEWHLKAASQIHPYSIAYIAEFFNFGRGVPANKKRALEWYLWCERIGHFENKHQVKILQSNGYSLNKQEKEKPLEDLIKEAEEILKIEMNKSRKKKRFQEKNFNLDDELTELRALKERRADMLKEKKQIKKRLDIQAQDLSTFTEGDIFALRYLSIQGQKESQAVYKQIKLLEEEINEIEEAIKSSHQKV